MDNGQLDILFLSTFPPSPPSFGVQRRMQGLMVALAARGHRTSAVSVVAPEFDAGAAERAMRAYCREVVLVPAAVPFGGPRKRLTQLRSILSPRSYVRSLYELPQLRKALDALLSKNAYDIVNVELPFLAMLRLAKAPDGCPPPRLILDEHNIEFDLARQQVSNELGLARRFYNAVNWCKLRREELAIWNRFDGVAFCSAADEARARALVPSMRSAVVPNAVDVEEFKPRAIDPRPDGRTVMFFGAMNYFPNVDGLRYLLREIWPLVEKTHSKARLKIIGPRPTPEILAFQGPRVEVLGKVDDLRSHLAAAAASIVPLRIGGGTRFKILEAMSMAKAVISTSIGAEGITAEPGRHLLIADDAAAFAAAIGRVLDEPVLGERLGKEGRALVEQHFSWGAAVQPLERLYRGVIEAAR